MSNAKSIFLAISSLTAGCLIYLLIRQDIIAFHWIGKPQWMESFRINIGYNGDLLTYCLLYCVSDALWYFSLLILQFQFYNKEFILCRILLYSTIVMPFTLEILQYFKLTSGTFDIFDIIFYLIALLIVLKIYNNEKK